VKTHTLPTVAEDELLALLEASARNVADVAWLLDDLFTAYPDSVELVDAILRCERDGDRITHDILHRLAERGTGGTLATLDAHRLAKALDDVVDHADEAAGRLLLYRIEAPMASAELLTGVLAESAAHIAAAVHATGDHGAVEGHLGAIHRLESDGDQLRRAAVGSLFADGIDPMTVIRWKDIFETLEAAIDACETVAALLEGIAVKTER
jgi:uncharacterized protein Yka (UPF0111/DUF47 family)